MNKKEESRKKKTHEGVRRFAGSQAAGGGVTPRQTNIIRHQRMRARKRKNAKKKTKRKRKRKTENGNRDKSKKERCKKKKGAMRDVGTGVYRRARVHGGHYASYVGLNAGDAS